MNAKYEFVPGDEKVIAPGRTVKRIRALVAISYFCSAGSLGGYIESEKSLDTSGNAWVSGDAQVYGNARVSGNALVSGDAWVFGNAQVYGNARVYGNAWVSGNARVSGNAWVSGNALVSGDAQVSGNARVSGNALVSGDAQVYGNALIVWFSHVGSENGTLTVYNAKDNTIEVTRGCFKGTINEFLAASEKKHDEQTHLEYRLLIEVAYSRITRARSNQ
jgi:carbonic anhydrase/acetyltransferase-like protein (isoleucine patch superfamily)